MSVKVKMNFDYSNYDITDHPDYLILSISKDLFEQIKKIAQIVKDNNLYLADSSNHYFDELPIFYDVDDVEYENVEYEYKLENISLIIRDIDFFIKAVMKHSDTEIEFSLIAIGYVEKLFKIHDLPIEQIPLYINDKDENIRNLVKERLERKE